MKDVDCGEAECECDEIPLTPLQFELKAIGDQAGNEEEHCKSGSVFMRIEPARKDQCGEQVANQDDPDEDLIAGFVAYE